MNPSQTRLLWRAKLPLGYLLYILCVFKSKTIREKKHKSLQQMKNSKKCPGSLKKGVCLQCCPVLIVVLFWGLLVGEDGWWLSQDRLKGGIEWLHDGS
jgi:hypothetical protein